MRIINYRRVCTFTYIHTTRINGSSSINKPITLTYKSAKPFKQHHSLNTQTDYLRSRSKCASFTFNIQFVKQSSPQNAYLTNESDEEKNTNRCTNQHLFVHSKSPFRCNIVYSSSSIEYFYKLFDTLFYHRIVSSHFMYQLYDFAWAIYLPRNVL